jgi:hypothetical protein
LLSVMINRGLGDALSRRKVIHRGHQGARDAGRFGLRNATVT